MRVVLAAAVFASFSLFPYAVRPSLLARGSPAILVWYGAASILGIAVGFVALLAATVSPGPLSISDLPRAVEICVGAAGRLLSHPPRHWPSILAAVLLLTAVARMFVAAAMTVRDGRRARPPRDRFPGEDRALSEHVGDREGPVTPSVRLLPVDAPVAYTTGFIRPVTVVSEGLMRALTPEERSAVLAHERSHASRRHITALSAARVVARAFGRVPGVRASTDLLVTGLEARADEDATAAVGDPLVVAQALAATARLAAQHPASTAGLGDGEIGYRIRHLTTERNLGMRRRLVGALVLVTVGMGLAQGVAWSAGREVLAREGSSLALHDTCHPSSEPAVGG